MKTTTLLLSALALGASIAMSTAQDNPPAGGPGGPEGPGRRPAPPLLAALDTNHDGVIDATEIANASASLKTLDKNNDGQLTMEELRPPRGPGGPGGGDQQGRRKGGKKDKTEAAQ